MTLFHHGLTDLSQLLWRLDGSLCLSNGRFTDTCIPSYGEVLVQLAIVFLMLAGSALGSEGFSYARRLINVTLDGLRRIRVVKVNLDQGLVLDALEALLSRLDLLYRHFLEVSAQWHR